MDQQFVEVSWIPVKQNYEDLPEYREIKALQSTAIQNPDLLHLWESVRGHGALDTTPIKGVDLVIAWKSPGAAKAVRHTPEAEKGKDLWLKVIESKSHYGPVRKWNQFFSMQGDNVAVVCNTPVQVLSGSFFPVDADVEAIHKSYKEAFEKPARPSGLVGTVYGWGVEDRDHHGQEKKVFMVITGWDSEQSRKEGFESSWRKETWKTLEDFNAQLFEHVSRLEGLK